MTECVIHVPSLLYTNDHSRKKRAYCTILKKKKMKNVREAKMKAENLYMITKRKSSPKNGGNKKRMLKTLIRIKKREGKVDSFKYWVFLAQFYHSLNF